MAVAADIIIQFFGIMAWFGVFAWLGYSVVLLRTVARAPMVVNAAGQKEFQNESFKLWPRIMTFMYLSGIGLCAVLCAYLYSHMTSGMLLIVLAFMLAGSAYLYLALRMIKRAPSRAAFRHSLLALYVASGYAAGLLIMIVYNPLVLRLSSGGIF